MFQQIAAEYTEGLSDVAKKERNQPLDVVRYQRAASSRVIFTLGTLDSRLLPGLEGKASLSSLPVNIKK